MRLAVSLCCAFLSLANPAAAMADDDSAAASVGVADVDITPEGPIRLVGYGSRKTESEGVEQRLHAKALAISSNATGPAVLVMVENCGVPATITEEVAARLQAKARVPRERFVVCSTHTHTGPALTGVAPNIFGTPIPTDQQERIDRYTTRLTDRIEEAALAAIADRSPGTLAWARGTLRFAANRRVLKNGRWTGFGVNPDGPVDPTMPLLKVTGADGKLRALVVGYACHCTTLEGNFNKVCGDWAGYAQEAIERAHPGAKALIVIGCGADANPEPRGKLSQAKEHGDAVAREVDRLLEGTFQPVRGTLSARFSRIKIPFGPLPTRSEWEERAKKTGAAGMHARAALARLDRGEALPTNLDYSVQSWSFNDDLCMVFLAGEVVVDYALRLKHDLDSTRLWVNAYSNDVPCYIASRRLIGEGGYEVDDSMLYYDRPTRLAPEAEDQIVHAVESIVPLSFRATLER